ncbi:uncharacterized protein si:ch1073-291c23.2 isoform X2 [Anguilla anguilla]|uniref:uncharacterized protein si:ch1073-291c23.2 isoform X2 n=1 Tax=Anguilla anguilla TaxID=7936 RepID=UPI0015A7808A|nr:uncharacterized protein si:ch1073-291c23.2 isoform X2 [Anguilla anguilla]
MDPPTEMTADEGQKNREMVVGGQKPLHRFLNAEPRCLGIAVLFFGCGELLLGIPLSIFVISGNLSIYTGGHPSKKMVTVCLSMYVVTLLGIFLSLWCRVHTLITMSFWYYGNAEKIMRGQVLTAESVLLTLSLSLSPVLIFLACRARAALKSTKTQVIVQRSLPSGE